jgi:hypothetical protein
MSASCYQVWSATTAALTAPPAAAASSATANTVKTVLQLKATQLIRVVEWGYTLTASPAAACEIELIDTGTVAATMASAFAAGDIVKYNNSAADAAPLTLGPGSSGYGQSTAEGTITATRLLDFNYENGLYIKKQIPLGREPEVPSTNYLRIRITPTTAAAISIVGYVIFEA